MINLKRFFRLSKNSERLDKYLSTSLKIIANRYRSIDPDTRLQWQKLSRKIEEESVLGTERQVSLKGLFSKPAVSVAVACLLLLVIAMIWLSNFSVKSYMTGKGEHSIVRLTDGTEVTLNCASKLEVTGILPGKSRKVLLAGEAFFNVKKNGKPFMVVTDVGVVKVLGTKFNVRARGNKMEVGVVEGQVEVVAKSKEKETKTLLSAGEIVICRKDGCMDLPKPIPFSEYPGWTQGKFVFYKTEFLSVCEELKLKFDVDVRLENLRLQELTITGVVNGKTIEEALTTLTQLIGAKYRHEAGGFVIY